MNLSDNDVSGEARDGVDTASQIVLTFALNFVLTPIIFVFLVSTGWFDLVSLILEDFHS